MSRSFKKIPIVSDSMSKWAKRKASKLIRNSKVVDGNMYKKIGTYDYKDTWIMFPSDIHYWFGDKEEKERDREFYKLINK